MTSRWVDRGGSRRGALALAVIASAVGCVVVPPGRGPASPGGDPGDGAGGPRSPVAAVEPTSGGRTGQVTVPDLIGKSFEEASALVRRAGFRNELEHSTPIECATPPPGEGRIRCQEPDPGAHVPSYTMVHVIVDHTTRRARELTEADARSVIGMTVPQATARLRGLGFTGEVETSYPRHYDACKPETVCEVELHGDDGAAWLYLSRKAVGEP